MSYSTFIDKIQSEKTVLFEIDLPEDQDFWLSDEAGIWKYKLTNVVYDQTFNFQNGAFCYGAFKEAGIADLGTNAIIKQLNSLQVDGTDYTKVTSVSTLRSTDESFYYEQGTTLLKVHFANFDPPDMFTIIEMGITTGFANRDIYLDNIFYASRVKSLPSVSKKKDPLYFGLIRYEGGNVSLFNNDGYFDNYAAEDLYGQAARFKLGGDDLPGSSYSTIFTGYIENWNIDNEIFNVKVQDKRKKLSRDIPTNFFTKATYADLSDNNVDKSIPLAWGKIRGAPIVCTNEDEDPVPAHYDFKICDVTNHEINSIDTVYVDGTSVAIHSPSTANATFSLTATTVYVAGDDVTCDFQGSVSGGSLINNSLDVVKDILDDYLSITYSSDTFDTAEWEDEEDNVYSVGVWLDKTKDIVKIIEEICASNFGIFIVNGDGKYNFKTVDTTADHVLKVTRDEEFKQPNAIYKSDEFLSSVIINYYKDEANDTYRAYSDTSQESTIFDLYSTYRQKTFETLLTESSDATALATRILGLFDSIKPMFSNTVKLQAAEVELVDNIVLQADRMDKDWFGDVKCECNGITYDFDNFTINLEGRYIEDYSALDLTFTGEWMTAGSIVFPAYLGAGDASVWDSTWTQAQKEYAREHFSYWCNDDGYADPVDPDSLNVSLWGSG